MYQRAVSYLTSCFAGCTYAAGWEGGAGLSQGYGAIHGGGGGIDKKEKTQAEDGRSVSEEQHVKSPFALTR